MLALLVLLVAATVLLARFADAAQTHPFTARDLHEMQRISDIEPAPDGRRIAFTLRVTDFDANRGRKDIWIVNCDGSGLRRLTTHPAGSSQPRWSADGRNLYFLSSRSDSAQVWRIALDGGEAEQVTRLPLDIGSFALAPDGAHLAVSIDVFPDARTLAETKQRLEQISQRKASGRLYERLFIRHWDTWKDGRRAHLFVVPAGGGEPVDLMKGLDADVPSKPFGGAEEYTFTPDGRSLLFALRNVGREEAWSTRFDLYLAPIDASAAPRVVVDGGGATLASPVFAPDGRRLAYLAMARPGYEADRFRIALTRWEGGAPHLPATVLTEQWDRSAARIVWSPDSKTIYTCAEDTGQRPLFAVDAQSGQVRRLTDSGRVTEVALAGQRVVYGLCHLRSPVELFAMPAAGRAARQITSINRQRLARLRLGEPEQFAFKGWNDETVYAYVLRPADFDPQRRYPVALLIHGGPQGSFGNDFHYRWNPQCFAGAGYAVVMVDFHGSVGYGQAFTDAINDHWGDRPLEDLQKGLAAALERYGWLDGARVAALGGSYGGYLINWIAGVWPERFRCLVCHDGNLDERMAYYDTEELWFPEWERGGPPWAKPRAYLKHNPIEHVGKWKTPMLVIHGANDFRVVAAQGISTFTALQRRGIPSRLLYFPDENHWVLKPHNSMQWYQVVLDWLDQWCGG